MGFASFSAIHGAALAGVAAFIGSVVGLGLRWRGTARQRWLERGLGITILLFRAGVLGWNLLPARFALERSLPLQICDLAAICSGLALLVDARWLMAIAYFWGLALSIQGLLQPDLSGGPQTLGFWLFWLHHALIVGTAIYLVAIRRYRPGGRDLATALASGVLYAVVVFAVDVVLGANYGYLGQRLPSQPTLLDWLGPWPWRVAVMVALGAIVMWLLLLPWSIAGASAGRVVTPTRDDDRRPV